MAIAFNMRRLSKQIVGLAAALAVFASLCGAVVLLASRPARADASGKKFTIYVSNNYIGNPWRAQMENAIRAIAARPPYNQMVNLVIVNSENTVTSQTASLQTIIRKKPAGILIDSSSATALNPTVMAACAAGIVVYTFDQTLTAPCAVQVRENDEAEAENMARWLAAVIHEKGDVILDEGIPGAPSSVIRIHAYQSVLRQFPNIHIVGTFVGNGAPGPELQQVSGLLASHRNIVGVVSQGYCSAEYQAFARAGLKPPACASLDTSVSAETCVTQNMACYMWPAPSWVGAYAFVQMLKQLSGGPKPTQAITTYEQDYFVTEQGAVRFDGDAYHQVVLKAGVNYFPNAPSSLVLPVTGGNLGLSVDDALKG
ncbi:MAG TPA: substrate-binding domain-containing protein [Acetobacteraceae bacterium]|nr:substrate-binding domain-containing protein [Acetobacteraceae bacterium]